MHWESYTQLWRFESFRQFFFYSQNNLKRLLLSVVLFSMAMTQYNALNSASQRRGTPSISINLKAGLFGINKDACALLEINEGDQLSFFNDEENTDTWCVAKVEENGFVARSTKDGKVGLFFNNTFLARTIAESIGFDGTSGRMPLVAEYEELEIEEGEEPLKAFTLLTAGLMRRKSKD